MTIAELLPQLQQLPDTEKLRLIEILAADLSGRSERERPIPLEPLPIWSPHDSYQAADALLRFARETKALS